MRFDYKEDAPVKDNYIKQFSAAELTVHRDVHMGDEAANLNMWLDNVDFQLTADEIYRLGKYCLPSYLRRYAKDIMLSCAGYSAHCIYFCGFSCKPEASCPEGNMAALIKESFGSIENFYFLFRSNTQSSLGSGFLWLLKGEKKHRRSGALKIIFTPPGILPHVKYKPILALDLWEHAWEGKFKNKADYASAYLASFDWESFR